MNSSRPWAWNCSEDIISIHGANQILGSWRKDLSRNINLVPRKNDRAAGFKIIKKFVNSQINKSQFFLRMIEFHGMDRLANLFTVWVQPTNNEILLNNSFRIVRNHVMKHLTKGLFWEIYPDLVGTRLRMFKRTIILSQTFDCHNVHCYHRSFRQRTP